MSFDRSDWADVLAARGKDRARAERPNLELLGQAEVRMSALTGDRHWDTYLSYIQSAIETTKLQRTQFETSLMDPDLMDSPEILRLKTHINRCSERIIAWESALSLPVDIIREGSKARGILERLEEKDPN